eukprot:410057-Rhodomonas_salina.1
MKSKSRGGRFKNEIWEIQEEIEGRCRVKKKAREEGERKLPVFAMGRFSPSNQAAISCTNLKSILCQ